ncbi:MAG: ABC transporter ATP-binding protein [Hungatella sp.]|nr:ABC transporter ATP-binding protein [Hungatella sp.]
MLKIENLKKMFGPMAALDGLCMHVRPGALYGFVGPNGAGKTTTIKVLTGLLLPDSGSVTVDGIDAMKEPGRVMEKIGYVPDFFGVYDNLKVWEYMELFSACGGLYGLNARKRSRDLLEQVGLGEKTEYYVDGLSRGMKQRLCLARALIHNPPILVMDEPTSGLDPGTRYEFKEILKELREQNKTVVISSHILSELSEVCTDIGIVEQGKMVVEGSINDILNQINVRSPLLITVCRNKEHALNLLRAHPYVETIAIRQNDIMVGFTGEQEDEAMLLRQLVEAGVMVCGFVRERGSLESVFLQIINHEEGMVLISEN